MTESKDLPGRRPISYSWITCIRYYTEMGGRIMDLFGLNGLGGLYGATGLYGLYGAAGAYGAAGLYGTAGAYGAAGLYGAAGAYGLPVSMASSLLAPTYAKFTGALQKALGERQTIGGSGDVVMSFPPRNTVDYKAEAGKDTKDMSPEEYRRYICNKIAGLPVSTSCRMNCNGMLVLKEEAFTNMQKDPAYEQEVLNMLGKGFQAQYPYYSSNLGLQVIGGSAGECYGTGLPALSGSSKSTETQGSSLQKARRVQEREQAYTQMRLGRGCSLAERLAANRAARLQQRENDWHK